MAQRGPKTMPDVDPLDFSDYPKSTAARYKKFIREFLVVPRGHGAGKPVRLRPFQREIIDGSFKRGVRTSLISMPRANGKTSLAAMIALAELFVGQESPEVLVVASDQRQANITFDQARRMVQANELLADRVQVYKDHLRLPERDGRLVPLSADPSSLHGYDPSLLIVDELHVVTRDTWEAATSAIGKRPKSLTLAISTPAASTDSLMWDLVQHGRQEDDPRFWLKEYAAPEGCAVDDPEAWKTANPAYAQRPAFLAGDSFAAAARTMTEARFRQLRLGQWVSGADAWLPHGLFEDLADEHREVPDGTKVVLGFDGSASRDTTALVGVTVEEQPHVFVVGLWEAEDDPRWSVPREWVDDAVRDAFRRYKVLSLVADPWGWRTELEGWSRRHGKSKVLQWNTADARRMAPATDKFYQAMKDGTVTHDGDERLSHHFAHCVAENTKDGTVIRKDKKTSKKKIDAAVATIAAFDRATFHANKPKGRVVGFRR